MIYNKNKREVINLPFFTKTLISSGRIFSKSL